MKSTIPEEQYQVLRSELAAAKQRFAVICALIKANYGDASEQTSRVEQIVNAIERFERELTRYDETPAKTQAKGE